MLNPRPVHRVGIWGWGWGCVCVGDVLGHLHTVGLGPLTAPSPQKSPILGVEVNSYPPTRNKTPLRPEISA